MGLRVVGDLTGPRRSAGFSPKHREAPGKNVGTYLMQLESLQKPQKSPSNSLTFIGTPNLGLPNLHSQHLNLITGLCLYLLSDEYL